MRSIAEFTNAFESMESAGAEQAQRADDNREWALEVEQELAAERALADRLAGLLELYFWKYEVRGDIGGISKSLAAWKEARRCQNRRCGGPMRKEHQYNKA